MEEMTAERFKSGECHYSVHGLISIGSLCFTDFGKKKNRDKYRRNCKKWMSLI